MGWRRFVWALTVTVTVACHSAPSTGPSGQPSSVTWSSLPIIASTGPSNGTQIAGGLRGVLVGGGSRTGPWLNLLEGQPPVLVADDVLGPLPDAASVGGIVSFGGRDFVLVGSTVDGNAPLSLFASDDDRSWGAIAPPGWADFTGARAVGLVATPTRIVVVATVEQPGDTPSTTLLVFTSGDGQTWRREIDAALTVVGHPHVSLTVADENIFLLTSPVSPALTGDPPLLLTGATSGNQWRSEALTELASDRLNSIAAAEGSLWVAGCAGDPSAASAWQLQIQGPAEPTEVALAKAESCAFAVVPADGGFVAVGYSGSGIGLWRWSAARRIVTVVGTSAPTSATVSGVAVSGAVYVVGSIQDIIAGAPQQAAAWRIDIPAQ
jgi:hypothetical protein